TGEGHLAVVGAPCHPKPPARHVDVVRRPFAVCVHRGDRGRAGTGAARVGFAGAAFVHAHRDLGGVLAVYELDVDAVRVGIDRLDRRRVGQVFAVEVVDVERDEMRIAEGPAAGVISDAADAYLRVRRPVCRSHRDGDVAVARYVDLLVAGASGDR